MLKKFHKQFLIIFAISLLILLIFGDLAIAGKEQTEGTVLHVFPGMSRDFIQTMVNDALDRDTIYFHAGIYNWSDAPLAKRAAPIGAINIIDKTLTIKGEEGALIVGPISVDGTEADARGVNAFHVKDLDTNNDVTFDGLSFQTFLRGICTGYDDNYPEEPNIMVPNVRNITIKNCTFSDIHRDAISLANARGNILIQNNNLSTDRICMFIDWYFSENHEEWQPEDSFIQILGNKINSGLYGIYFAQSTNVLIEENTIDCLRFGILNNGGAKIRTIISSNSIFNCMYGINIYGYFRDGIEIVAKEAVIEKNKLYDITRYGIWFDGNASYGHTISKNEINMWPDSWAGIYSEVHDNYYGQNKISGSGLQAITLWGSANHETLQANNVDQFLPVGWGHFYFAPGTHDNLVIGSGMEYNTYYDEGTNNRITGVTPMAGGIGQDLSEAVKERNEELKEAKKIKF